MAATSRRDPHPFPRPENDTDFMLTTDNHLMKRPQRTKKLMIKDSLPEVQPWNRLHRSQTLASLRHRTDYTDLVEPPKKVTYYDPTIVYPPPTVYIDPYLFDHTRVGNYTKGLCVNTKQIMERSPFFRSCFDDGQMVKTYHYF